MKYVANEFTNETLINKYQTNDLEVILDEKVNVWYLTADSKISKSTFEKIKKEMNVLYPQAKYLFDM